MSEKQITKEYVGTLRPRITYLGRGMEPIQKLDRHILSFPLGATETTKDVFKIEWIEGDDVTKVIWTEEVKVLPGVSFVPQIVGYGTYTPGGAMYVDADNLRHRVLNAEVGKMGSPFGGASVEIGNRS